MIRMAVLCVVTALGLGLYACSEKPQTSGGKKTDGEPWQASDNAFVTSGWKSGDRAAWEEQLRSRAQTQNEYAKAK
jgi:hypothetical protein